METLTGTQMNKLQASYLQRKMNLCIDKTVRG